MQCTYCGSHGYQYRRSIGAHGELTYSCEACSDHRLDGDGFNKLFLFACAITGAIILAIILVA